VWTQQQVLEEDIANFFERISANELSAQSFFVVVKKSS
jgi:hypothetical protein